MIVIDVVLITSTLAFDISPEIYSKIITFDVITCIFLLFDFFRGFFKSEDKMEYFKENWMELIASIPFDLIFSSFMFLRYLKLIRLFRILVLIVEYFSVIGDFLKDTRLDEILAVVILIITGSTLGLYLADPGMNNLFENLWFVVVSITTVGYGDITPTTVYGKIISLILLVVGVFVFSAITGAISTYFMDGLLKEGSYHIYELGKKMDKNNDKIDEMSTRLAENEKTITELRNEISELKDIIREK